MRVLLLLLLLASRAFAIDVLIMVGESTTWGLRADGTQTPTNAGAVLEMLLAQRLDCPYGGLPVRNWALPSTQTEDWFEQRPSAFCAVVPRGQNPVLDYACEMNVPMAEGVVPVASARGETIRGLLVNAQGTNDAHMPTAYRPSLTVERISRWPQFTGGAPVWISPPFAREDAPDSITVELTGRRPRTLANYVRRVRKLELRRGLITGPDWGIVMPHPTFQADGFHLKDGAYAAAGAHWLDVLCP